MLGRHQICRILSTYDLTAVTRAAYPPFIRAVFGFNSAIQATLMKKLVVHIGGPKCGSSAIQAVLKHQSQNLNSHGYYVPDRNLQFEGPYDGHHLWAIEAYAQNISGMAYRIRQLSRPNSTIIISAENICNFPFMADYFKRASDAYDSLKVVLYVRNQVDFFISAWPQWGVKHGSNFQHWVNCSIGSMANWNAITTEWEQVVGKSNMIVRSYHNLVNKDSSSDFLTQIGCPIDNIKPIYVNGAIDEDVASLAECNPVFKDLSDNDFYSFMRQNLGPRFFRKDKKSYLFDLKLRQRIYHTYAQGNEQLRQRYFPNIPGPLFQPPKPEDVSPDGEIQVLKRQNRLLARILFQMWKERQ